MDPTHFQIDVLGRLLDAAAVRHKVIANNVANVNTPGFKRLDVTFEDDLLKAMQASQPVAAVQPQIVVDPLSPERVDGNTVDIDQEMNNLNKNSLLYEAAAQILASRIASLRSAIRGS